MPKRNDGRSKKKRVAKKKRMTLGDEVLYEYLFSEGEVMVSNMYSEALANPPSKELTRKIRGHMRKFTRGFVKYVNERYEPKEAREILKGAGESMARYLKEPPAYMGKKGWSHLSTEIYQGAQSDSLAIINSALREINKKTQETKGAPKGEIKTPIMVVSPQLKTVKKLSEDLENKKKLHGYFKNPTAQDVLFVKNMAKRFREFDESTANFLKEKYPLGGLLPHIIADERKGKLSKKEKKLFGIK